MTKPFIIVIVRPVTQVMHLMPESIVNIRRHRIAPNNHRRPAVLAAATVTCFVSTVERANRIPIKDATVPRNIPDSRVSI
jgi:hypothetical protein